MENSMLDILVVTKTATGLKINTLFNNIDRSSFFLKTRVLTDEIEGTTVSTASVRCVLTDIDDNKFIVVGGQTARTAYHSLSPPYSNIGIGRINNFVESLTVAMYVEGQRVIRSWSPIIPKSVLFVITDMEEDETKWKLDILVKPTEKLPLIVLCDGIFLFGLGLIIIVLHLNEKVRKL
jgi:hypothetical protein